MSVLEDIFKLTEIPTVSDHFYFLEPVHFYLIFSSFKEKKL